MSLTTEQLYHLPLLCQLILMQLPTKIRIEWTPAPQQKYLTLTLLQRERKYYKGPNSSLISVNPEPNPPLLTYLAHDLPLKTSPDL